MVEPVLGNFVVLEANKPKRLRFVKDSLRIVRRVIVDPKTKIRKVVKALELDVAEEDGIPVSKVFSTLSEKLAKQLIELHRLGILYTHVIEITRIPRDFATEYVVRVL